MIYSRKKGKFNENIFYVYILKCSNGVYYVGRTNNLQQRLKEHEIGINEGSYTAKRRPVQLAYYEIITHKDPEEAKRRSYVRELELKDFSHKRKFWLSKKINEINKLLGKHETPTT